MVNKGDGVERETSSSCFLAHENRLVWYISNALSQGSIGLFWTSLVGSSAENRGVIFIQCSAIRQYTNDH